jgi:hypothetical protein
MTRYNVCNLVCKVYNKAMSAENLIAAFRKTGIHPCSRAVIPSESLKPAEVFRPSEATEDEVNGEEVRSECLNDVTGGERRGESDPGDCRFFFETREKAVRDVKTKGASEKKERNTMSKIISGHCITKNDILEQMTQHEHQQKSKETVKRKAVSPDNNEGASGSGSKKTE